MKVKIDVIISVDGWADNVRVMAALNFRAILACQDDIQSQAQALVIDGASMVEVKADWPDVVSVNGDEACIFGLGVLES